MVTKNRPRVNYLDFLELLLANLPDQEYKADSGAWTTAVYQLREKYGRQSPELFRDFVLIERPPLAPHSDQVSHFLRVEQEADIFHVLNPGYERLLVPPESKELLRRRNEQLLREYGDQIKKMVEEILPLVSLEQTTNSA